MAAIDVGVAMAPMAGETAIADRHVIRVDNDEALVAVVDGIGHGQEAARAAMEAVRALDEPPRDSLGSLVARCHDRLRETRGAVMSMARLDLGRGILTWLGVGNVAGVLLRAGAGGQRKESLIPRSGVVGHLLPPLQLASLPLVHGDTLVFATDGVSSRFDEEPWSDAAPQHLAERILKKHGKGTDDALVVVVRYKGSGP